MKKKAFTLIELLAVIVILAIIALVTIPIILNVVNNSKQSAFKNTAYGLIDSVKLQYAENLLNSNIDNLVYTFPEAEGLRYSGEIPKGGTLRFHRNGDVSIAIYNDQWCAIKGVKDEKVVVFKYEEGKCLIPEEKDIPVITLVGDSTIILAGSSYIEPGYSVKTMGGEEISNDQVKISILGQDSKKTEIDVNTPDTYIITYTVTYKGNKSSMIRTIIVEERQLIADIVNNASDTMANDPDGNVRYVGPNPNNYVMFNNELWRIIGVFDGQAKIIRNEPYRTVIAWDEGHSPYGWNDWSQATLQKELNTTFFNSIATASKSLIDTSHIWNLGGISGFNKDATREKIYEFERGTTVYSGRPTTWRGAIGLMYSSDYGYTTSSTNDICDTSSMNSWYSSGDSTIYSECVQKSWLYRSSNHQWTITSRSASGYSVLVVNMYGRVLFNNANLTGATRPVLYLKSNIKIIGGNGTVSEPYILGI